MKTISTANDIQLTHILKSGLSLYDGPKYSYITRQ